MYIIWPDSNDFMSENKLNNNSVVAKFCYKNFSCIFTGDIEKIAEEKIINTYQNQLYILKADILKVGHHGSKTSSTQDFLEKIKPRIALIGVGEKNTFGHPNQNVIDRLNSLGAKVFRTDENGEISIIINNKR